MKIAIGAEALKDYNTYVNGARLEGRKEGREEGMKIGINVILDLLRNGASPENILRQYGGA